MTFRLLKRSARNPAGAANTRNGSVKHASPSDSASEFGSIQCRTIAGMSFHIAVNSSLPMGTTSQRNMLSFSDTKNWVATRARKLREYTPPRVSSVRPATSSLMASFPTLSGEAPGGMQRLGEGFRARAQGSGFSRS